MYCYEVYKLNNLQKESVNMVTKYSENRRRRLFACRYTCRTLVWFTLFASTIGAAYFFVPQTFCKEGQATDWVSVCTDCRLQNCGKCEKAGLDSCDSCNVGFFFNAETNKCEDCDLTPDSAVCKFCESKETCTECNVGFRLATSGPSAGKC